MIDVKMIREIEEAGALLQPLRLRVLSQLAQARSCAEVGLAIGETPQKVHYHVKVLERAHLVEKVSERRVRALAEGLYQAVARSYWLSPRLVERIGGPRLARDAASLEHLFGLAEDLSIDLGALAQRVSSGNSVPSLGLSADVELADPSRRMNFLRDVEAAVRAIATKYGRAADSNPPATSAAQPAAPTESFRLTLACYPRFEAASSPASPPNSKGEAS